MISPQRLTVGCGVFAVRAKISPPVVTMRRGVFCSDVACRVAVIIMPHRGYMRAASFMCPLRGHMPFFPKFALHRIMIF